jgi:hypothetical protein
MNFSTLAGTRAEAQQLDAGLFPGPEIALAPA